MVDYTSDDFAGGGRRWDVILDIGGNTTLLPRVRGELTPTGTLVILGGESGERLTGVRRKMKAAALCPVVRQRLAMLVAGRANGTPAPSRPES